jgi:hypothetical protein
MKRREFACLAWPVLLALHPRPAPAFQVSEAEAVAGLRAALERGARAAVGALGRTDGFLLNPQVCIPLPDWLERSAGLLRAVGQGPRLDQLHTSMNRAAEAAVVEARPLLVDAVKRMSIRDARSIITGGDTSATQFFQEKTREPLGTRLLPIVTRATARLSLAQRYNSLAARAASLGLVDRSQAASVEQHVTARTLDGLFLMIGEEEKKIRQNPVATGTAVLQRVFGPLK